MLSTTLKYGGLALILGVGAAELSQKMSLSLNERPPQPAIAQRSAPTPAPAPQRAAAPVYVPTPSTLDEFRIAANEQGHYFADVYVDGQPIKVVVDTGATSVALREEDAAALGLNPAPSEFTVAVQTANGVAHAAAVKLREVKIGAIQLFDVDALVTERGALGVNLLGMTFLSRLSRVEIVGGSLLLRK
ncbi:TIGR02281 family clan AA aspartic protease [Methylocystis heyeri]|uniref:TIGR02281 family clan AA aspartic protease n=1 Tax=Methylocystis heyeri TaxID=391905 RepID=A0A6B8KD57_9HYPH|nr:TIGR02281 family clan AA aspartic protease [Methylocystis heyeri]QGM46166.1 TIGR02281 family clan AA aspartic protease [Methylocystis heyeri]